jgi:hypothetical protein
MYDIHSFLPMNGDLLYGELESQIFLGSNFDPYHISAQSYGDVWTDPSTLSLEEPGFFGDNISPFITSDGLFQGVDSEITNSSVSNRTANLHAQLPDESGVTKI